MWTHWRAIAANCGRKRKPGFRVVPSGGWKPRIWSKWQEPRPTLPPVIGLGALPGAAPVASGMAVSPKYMISRPPDPAQYVPSLFPGHHGRFWSAPSCSQCSVLSVGLCANNHPLSNTTTKRNRGTTGTRCRVKGIEVERRGNASWNSNDADASSLEAKKQNTVVR